MNILLLIIWSFFYTDNHAKQLVLPERVKIPCWREPNPSRHISSYPFLAADTFRAFADHVFDESRVPFDSGDINHGDTIFVNSDYMNIFFEMVHPEIPHPYILITHTGLLSAPGEYIEFLESDKIIAWFAKNIALDHPKLHGLPIGLANRHWPHGSIEIVDAIMKKKIPKDKLLYSNFTTSTHISRAPVAAFFKDKLFCFHAAHKSYKGYMFDMARSKFVLSPRGAGIDCHRTWEALLVGAIPIVPGSTINDLYHKLPVLIVHDWSIITQDFLNEKWEQMQQSTYDYERMFAQHWLDEIKVCQKKAREKCKEKAT